MKRGEALIQRIIRIHTPVCEEERGYPQKDNYYSGMYKVPHSPTLRGGELFSKLKDSGKGNQN